MIDHATRTELEAAAFRRLLAHLDSRKDVVKLGWRNDNWNVSVWGKNLTDDGYAGLTSQIQGFSGSRALYLEPPRTYGVTLRYDFY